MAQVSSQSPGDVSGLNYPREKCLYQSEKLKMSSHDLVDNVAQLCYKMDGSCLEPSVMNGIRDFSSLTTSTSTVITLQSLSQQSSSVSQRRRKKSIRRPSFHEKLTEEENADRSYDPECADTPELTTEIPLISLTTVSPKQKIKALCRTQSLPNLVASSSPCVFSTLQRNGDSWRTPSQKNTLEENKMLSWNSSGSSYKTNTSGKISPLIDGQRDGVIDLTQADPEGLSGHKRRVLVRPLPALRTPRIQGQDSVDARGFAHSETSESNEEGSFPVWQRPRAFSCDVTLEVEVGKDLRKIANEFNKTSTSSTLRARGVLARMFQHWTDQRIPTPIQEISPNLDRTNFAPP